MSTEVKITPETFIDRSRERTIFRSMFAVDSDTGLRVMQISVPSGGGKSGLLTIFFEFCRLGEVEARPVLVDFKTIGDVTALDVAVLVQKTLERGAPKAFERFTDIYEDFQVERRQRFFPASTPQSITVNLHGEDLKNTTMTGYKQTNKVRGFTNAIERAVAQTKCLEVFDEELRTLLASMDVLVIVDHWEQGPGEVKDWLRRQLVRDGIATIEGGPSHARLRVVVAGQPLSDRQPAGLDQREFLDWFPRPVEYKAAVSVHDSLSSFADEDVKSFMALYGMSEEHPDYQTVFPHIRHLAGQGMLETARQLVQSYTSGGSS